MLHKTENLILEKASPSDWNDIYSLLEENKLTKWFTGEENVDNFYVVKLNDTVVNCFALYLYGNTALLKQFAVSKAVQGKGVGKYVANKLIPSLAKSLNIKSIFLQAGNRGDFTSLNFWKKTAYAVVDDAYLTNEVATNYFQKIKECFPDDYFPECRFYMNL